MHHAKIHSPKNNHITFTQRESQCATLAMQGKNLLQIAENLNITQQSAYFYLNSTSHKISALSRPGLQRNKKG